MKFNFQVGRDENGDVCRIRVDYTFVGNSVPGLVYDLRQIADEILEAHLLRQIADEIASTYKLITISPAGRA